MIQLRAPAKINICLFLLGRRNDGYHLLESLVAPISLFDQVDLRVDLGRKHDSLDIVVDSDCPDAPGGSSNLAYRAARAFGEATGLGGCVEIALRKGIPVGSGLGGGSSDAAAVLVALNSAAGRVLNKEELVALASKLGADVPLFVHGTPSLIQGVGEKVDEVALPYDLDLVVCSDRAVLATREVFARVDLSLTTGSHLTKITRFIDGQAPISEILHNDLEPAASMLHPNIKSTRERLLESGATGALMTGSGSAVFGICPDQQSASTIAQRMRDAGLWAEAVRTCRSDVGYTDGR